jgi:hypothetical protein
MSGFNPVHATNGSERFVGNYVWDSGTLAWVPATTSSGGAGGDVNVTNTSIAVTQSGAWTITGITNPVAVTGSFFQATQPVSILSMPTTPVTGPLTDTQLRATPVPVSLTSTTVTGTVTTVETPPTTVDHGVQAVSTAGTRVQLASNTCKAIVIKALVSNAGTIFVGGSLVSAANGFPLAAGDTISLDISNTNVIWIDASANAQSVSWMSNS